ncbi:MAG: phosphatase PAP2 family protein [Actinomycetota bacterium]
MERASPETSTRPRLDGDLVREPGRALMVSAAMLAGVALLAIVVALEVASPPFLQGLDDAWRRRVLAWPAWTRRLGDLFELLGSGFVMAPLRIAVAAWLAFRRRRWDLVAWLLAWLAADLLTFALKPGLARARPTPTDPDNPFTSFPSAHAKTAAQVAIGLVLIATSPWRGRRLGYALALAWVALMALSRTVLDHHWLSDVVAGSLLGAACAVGVAAATQRFRDHRARNRRVPQRGG